MKHLLALLLALCLASCVHTAAAPVATPSGEPVAIRVPDVPTGGSAKPSQLMAIDERLLEGVTSETLVWRYFPDLEGRVTARATLVGIVGEVKTKRGRTIHAYVPIVVLQSDAPAPRVEDAAKRMAVDLYRRAKKTCEVYPLSQIADKPKS
jgi:hypothetical protein